MWHFALPGRGTLAYQAHGAESKVLIIYGVASPLQANKPPHLSMMIPPRTHASMSSHRQGGVGRGRSPSPVATRLGVPLHHVDSWRSDSQCDTAKLSKAILPSERNGDTVACLELIVHDASIIAFEGAPDS